MAPYDVVVVGIGAMGSAALYQLARRGMRAVGIERFEPGHDRGSSHGLTRIIRLGYFEHPSYVPLLRRAYELWRELEAASGRRMLHITGIAEIGRTDSAVITGTLKSSRLHDLPHEVLDAGELMRRYPMFRVPDDFIGVFQPDGGFLEPEVAVQTHVARARKAGAELRTNERVHAIEPRGGGVRVMTERGEITAGAAIVTVGAWIKTLLPTIPAPLWATREVLGWFEPQDAAMFAPERFPVFFLESRHGWHYGFPIHGAPGVKVAKHHHRGEIVDPERYSREVKGDDEALIRAMLAEHLPAANGRLLQARTCLYTMTPDSDFMIDALPEHPEVIVASPCSGHGFKFASVIGEILADLATAGKTRHDISRFRLARFRATASTVA